MREGGRTEHGSSVDRQLSLARHEAAEERGLFVHRQGLDIADAPALLLLLLLYWLLVSATVSCK